ncbi:hypothetical protein TVAG_417740 [Trichomonas vaginalis G3]|uniref:Uncharacterized protein n=1 Tax=Trichomonas vaginalis (strain ATCC PRA-98 / G3) TaxID=412133 RepID=A2ED94_TRIV3|nr:SCF-dependent proteasomal ubiquitin-dependent protein catabolic process [Trichomonas vaginalis G3]EAY09352.1 hypothetical protein TVAG_417740 [Trichomonas vaginalis G3]KAI5501712.1 SCF-dependent proteasomal ubiquitin-dependent protein catabolic process [Trichomonas vaginalis G3]|eukprot:XP_001321575.1 hypothetical protein [Trichomonas vaginalis G3]
MSIDEDIKEGRYFPRQQEQEILISSIEKYFSYPERSEQRTQIVQNITHELQKISNRWNNRSVRLWFNNNKKTFLKPEPTVTFAPPISETSPMLSVAPISSQFVPPKKRIIPPRSSSVAQFAPTFPPPSPHPFSYQTTPPISTIILAPKGTIQEQKDLEVDLTAILAQSLNNNFLTNVMPIEQLHPIIAQQSMPEGFATNTFGHQPLIRVYNEKSIENFAMLENGVANANGMPAIVYFDTENQQHILKYNNQTINLNIHNSITSFYYNKLNNTFYLAAGKHVHRINQENNLEPLISTTPLYLSSCITSYKDQTILCSRRNISIYNDQSVNPIFSLNTNLPSVNSATEAADSLCIASKNHHSIHVLDVAQNKLVSVLIDHAASVTCLNKVGNNLLVSGSADSTARIWDVRQRQQLSQIMRHIGSLTFVNNDSGEDNVILTGGEDGTVKGWDIRMDKCIFDVPCGTGIPIDASIEQNSKELVVITQQKSQTTASGFKNPSSSDPQRSVANLEPNLCIRFATKQ